MTTKDREEFEAWARPLHYILDPDAFSGDCSFYHSPETRTAWAIWQAARAQPAEQEPVANLHDDGYWTACKTSTGRALNDRLLFAGSLKVPVYTQPPRREPLSDEQAHNNAVAPHAKRLAMELECLLLDCEDMAVVSKWFDSGMEAIQNYQDAVRAIEAAIKEQPHQLQLDYDKLNAMYESLCAHQLVLEAKIKAIEQQQ